MRTQFLRALAALFVSAFLFAVLAPGQDAPPPAAPAPAADLPAVPQGIEVQARGPVHEAFAAPNTDPVPTALVAKQPPAPLDEMPPDQKPSAESVWIGGYWAWDDDRKDYLWVSGIWRTPPPGKQWVGGYWRQEDSQWRWVPGFWSDVAAQASQNEVTYLPPPPRAPEIAGPGPAPAPNAFYVPGYWTWTGTHYGWRAGYWAQIQPGYVWVPAHFVWTPGGYVFVAGYWDLAVSARGVLFAPVYVDPALVGTTFVYTPAYVVRDTIVLDSLFVRTSCRSYYFGDYYGPAYRDLGFESCIVYSRRNYDCIFTYECWEHRDEPRWATLRLDICLARHAGQAPVPPRTLVQQNTIVQNVTNVNNVTNVTNVTNNVTNTTVNNAATNTVLVPVSKMASVTGRPTVPLTPAARVQVQAQAQAIQQVALQRTQTEIPVAPTAAAQPRKATLRVPPAAATAVRPSAPAIHASSAQVNPGAHFASPALSTSPASATHAAHPANGRTYAPSGPPVPHKPNVPAASAPNGKNPPPHNANPSTGRPPYPPYPSHPNPPPPKKPEPPPNHSPSNAPGGPG